MYSCIRIYNQSSSHCSILPASVGRPLDPCSPTLAARQKVSWTAKVRSLVATPSPHRTLHPTPPIGATDYDLGMFGPVAPPPSPSLPMTTTS